jgi:hypothetical protein
MYKLFKENNIPYPDSITIKNENELKIESNQIYLNQMLKIGKLFIKVDAGYNSMGLT